MLNQPPDPVISLLQAQGFQIFSTERSGLNSPAVDHIARKGDTLLLIKYERDIDRLSSDEIEELKYLSHVLRGIPMIVGERNRRGDLEENIIYNRNGVSTLSVSSLNIFLEVHSSLTVYAKRGGYFVKIDGNKLRKLRESRNISRMAIAGLIGVSKKAVDNYERNAMNPAVEKYNILKEYFGEEFDRPVEPKEWLEEIILPDRQGNTGFQKEISEIIKDLGLQPFWSEKSPFDLFISRSSPDKETHLQKPALLPIVSDVTEGEQDKFNEKIQAITNFHAIIHERVLFIVDEEPPDFKRSTHPIPVIRETELRTVRDLKDLQKKFFKI